MFPSSTKFELSRRRWGRSKEPPYCKYYVCKYLLLTCVILSLHNQTFFYLCQIQSTLVIVYLVIVESLDIVDRAVWPIVYFSMFLSRNSGISCNSGQFLGDQKIHYYECRLYKYLYVRYSVHLLPELRNLSFMD